jgi:hypothetical protein
MWTIIAIIIHMSGPVKSICPANTGLAGRFSLITGEDLRVIELVLRVECLVPEALSTVGIQMNKINVKQPSYLYGAISRWTGRRDNVP